MKEVCHQWCKYKRVVYKLNFIRSLFWNSTIVVFLNSDFLVIYLYTNYKNNIWLRSN